MERTGKIALWGIGGLALATGLFFGIRAIIKSTKTEKDSLSSAEKRELESLRKKGDLTETEQIRLDELDNVYIPNKGETTQLGSCSFPLKNGDTCKEVAQIQLAINKKHNPSGIFSGGGGNWACLPAYPGQHDNLLVDGQLGSSTAKLIGRFYELCESSGFLYEVCDCQSMSISKASYDNIISGVDVSDAALLSAGYSSFSGFSGSTNYFNPSTALNNNGYIEFNGYSNFNLPNYGKKYDSPLGDFYKNKLAFTDDYPKQSPMQHSYGMGKGYSFAGANGINTSTGVATTQNIPAPSLPSAFTKSISNMGCNGLNSRKNVLTNKLEKLKSRGSNPNWQMQLKNKINHIQQKLSTIRCQSNYSGFSGEAEGDYISYSDFVNEIP